MSYCFDFLSDAKLLLVNFVHVLRFLAKISTRKMKYPVPLCTVQLSPKTEKGTRRSTPPK